MARRRGVTSGLHAALRRLPFLALVALAVSSLALAAMLLFRYGQIARGEGAVESPRIACADAPAHIGRLETSLALTTPGAPDDAELSIPLTWDDSWFFADPRTCDRGLASAASVLAALAYSESGYYQTGSACPAYMERALERLGFSEVSTESYRYRSEVLDQILNLFTEKEDSVAYTIARKDVTDAGSHERSVILVSVRGSYGVEWLSNLDIADVAAPGATLAAADDVPSAAGAREDADPCAPRGDHAGYVRAAEEVLQALAPWIDEAHDQGNDVSVLLVGHSRGGAIANLVARAADEQLVAARADSNPQEGSAPLRLMTRDSVYAYTFASPNTTTSADADQPCYANIFNVVNPSDIMPYLPLDSWGYRRYGVTLLLPAVDDAGFDQRHKAMRERFSILVGAESPYDPDDARTVSALVSDVGDRVRSARELMTPAGVASVLASCAPKLDPVRILYGHYPCIYVAWMQVIDDDGLTRAS